MKELFDPEELIHAYGIYEREEGREEGHAKGMADGQTAYIAKFIENGWNVDKIAEFLGETPENIEMLLQRNNNAALKQ